MDKYYFFYLGHIANNNTFRLAKRRKQCKQFTNKITNMHAKSLSKISH